MKDYKDLFYFKREKDRIKKTMEEIDVIKGKLIFYDNEFNLSTLDKAHEELDKLYKELSEEVKEEVSKFTAEEIDELALKYVQYKKDSSTC